MCWGHFTRKKEKRRGEGKGMWIAEGTYQHAPKLPNYFLIVRGVREAEGKKKRGGKRTRISLHIPSSSGVIGEKKGRGEGTSLK